MNTRNMTQEQISAFADGELTDDQSEAVMAALRTREGEASWDVYHQIGDALRSDDMAFELSPDFAKRMASRLEEEPTIVAPLGRRHHAEIAPAGETVPVTTPAAGRRFLLQGMAAVATVAMAFVAVPQLMVAMKAEPAAENATTMVASSRPVAVPAQTGTVAAQRRQGEVLRDPGIDEYLLAHQRFSPSVYSTAQYARSATFAIDSEK